MSTAKQDDRRLNYAVHVVDKCEADLRRTLTSGERRDLLKDNTDWDNEFVARCVEWMRQPEGAQTMTTQAELTGLRNFAKTMTTKDLKFQIANAKKLGVPPEPFRAELASRGESSDAESR